MKIFYRIAALILMTASPVNAETAMQSHDFIYEIVKDYIEQNISAAYEYEINIIPIDNLLALPECGGPLEATSTSELAKVAGGRVAVGVHCNIGNKWSIFVTAVIKYYQEVPVLMQAVHRGDIITPQHFVFEKREIKRLGEDYAVQPEQLENKQATRFLPAGTILTSRAVAEPTLVKRGEKIVIDASLPGFSVRMNGLAMMDGAKGQRIRIKNESSGRIISATVIEPGIVSVGY